MLINLQIPCAQCNKLVDRIISEENYSSGEIKFTVFCHGDYEETTLNLTELLNVKLTPLKAFKYKKLKGEGSE